MYSWKLSNLESVLTLIRGFLGPSPSVISEKKSKINTGGVTVGTLEMKIICADIVADFKCHMPIWGENFPGKYALLTNNICHFWDHHRASFPKNIKKETYKKAKKHIQMTQCCTLDFSRKTRSVMVPRFGFFQDSRIRVKGTHLSSLYSQILGTTFMVLSLNTWIYMGRL